MRSMCVEVESLGRQGTTAGKPAFSEAFRELVLTCPDCQVVREVCLCGWQLHLICQDDHPVGLWEYRRYHCHCYPEEHSHRRHWVDLLCHHRYRRHCRKEEDRGQALCCQEG